MESSKQKFVVLATPKFPFHKCRPIPQVFDDEDEAFQRLRELEERKFKVKLIGQ